MDLYTLDFETYFNSKAGYTLKKLTTEEYIRHPEFYVQGVGISKNGSRAKWFSADKVAGVSQALELHKHMVLAHNALFDGSILSWVYGIRPAILLDTLGMARGKYGHSQSLSLANLAKLHNLGEKGTELYSVEGVKFLSPEQDARLGAYCCNDVELTYKLFKALVKDYPPSELEVIDMTLRMFTEPVLELDQPLLERAIRLEEEKKESLLTRIGATRGELSSNPQFAAALEKLGVEPPKKISPRTGKLTYAFAKGDSDFKALQDHENEDVRWLVEARLGVKSTIAETRAGRFLSIAKRGKLPIPLGYYYAHTGRYGGMEKINVQNLQRVKSDDENSGLIRKSIIAPPGHKIVVADAAQIEARIAMWLAGQQDVVDAFAAGEDVYSKMATVIYNRPVDRKKVKADFIPGFVGKCVTLGCFAADTKVLTNRGWVDIVSVNLTDLVWDGEEWVTHMGVVPRGMKKTIRRKGVSATPDHEILTGHGWREWQEVHTNHFLWRSAVKLGNLPSSIGLDMRGKGNKQDTNQSSNARAAGQAWLIDKISSKEEQQDARIAHKFPGSRPGSIIGGMKQSCLSTNSGSGCSIEYRQSLVDAQILNQNCTICMGGGEYPYTKNGFQTEKSSLRTLYHSPITQRPIGILTESTMTGDMNRVICGSLRSRKMLKIEEKSPLCRKESLNLSEKMPVYDIYCSGPRNRFTIQTEDGPVIAHNCQYGLGHVKFAGMIFVGMLGGPGLVFDQAFVDSLRVDVEWYRRKVETDKDLLERVETNHPSQLEWDEWITHCACAEKIIRVYRTNTDKIPELWRTAQEALEYMWRGSEFVFGPNGCLRTEKNAIVLPNGMRINYWELEKKDGEFTYLGKKDGKVRRVKTYGGSVVENICQALARILITDAMRRIRRKYKIANQVHDEIVSVAPVEKAKEALGFLIVEMCKTPAWAEGLPLAAEGDIGDSYGDAK